METDRLQQQPKVAQPASQLEAPAHEDIWTSAFDSKTGVSAPPPPFEVTAGPLTDLDDAGGGGEGRYIAGKGYVQRDDASMQSLTHSKQLGQELGSNPDAHISYERHVMVDADDGRQLRVTVMGRTTLDALHQAAMPGIDVQGMSYATIQIEVVGDFGKKTVLQGERFGADGSATMRALLTELATEQGVAPSLVLPGVVDEGYLDALLTVADRVQPLLPRDKMAPVERLDKPERVDHTPLKDWDKMTEEERRAEAWAVFKDAFSWEDLAMAALGGAAVFAVMAESPYLAVAFTVVGADMAIAFGIYTVIAPYLDGADPEVAEWLKGGLLVVGGALAAFMLAASSEALAAAAGFAATMAAVAYVVTEIVTAITKFGEAVVAGTRDDMRQLARQSATEAQHAIIDGVLVIPAIKALPKMLQKMALPKTEAPGVEAMPAREEVVSTPTEDVKNVVPTTNSIKNALGLPAIKKMTIKFKPNSKHDAAEFGRQVQAQEDGLNRLTVEEYFNNRNRYLEEGRAPESGRAQKKYRDVALERKIEELQDLDENLKFDEAKSQAERWLEGQAVLHNPDQVAGGNPNNVGGLGDQRVNSSLGSQWSQKQPGESISRATALDRQVRTQMQGLTPEQRLTTYLNFELAW